MERFRVFPIVLALTSTAAGCALLPAQTAQDAPASNLKVKIVREGAPPMPFPPGSEAPGPVQPIEFRSVELMAEKDRTVVAGAESSIAERARFAGLEFNEGPWSYRQMVCPALPNHIFLRFTRNNGTGDVSMFSASIPTNGAGHVRIIPILRRSYSLFSPAPINAITISAFNRIRDEEHPSTPPDWLGTGLCYAALAGAQPETPVPADLPENRKYPSVVHAELDIPLHGGAVIRFAEAAATLRPIQWTMTFDGKGRLLKATHFAAPPLPVKIFPQGTVEAKGSGLPPTVVVDPAGKPVVRTDQPVNPAPQN
jgi:hypothetical protein